MIKYDTIKEICDKAEARGIKISELCLEDQSEQMGLSKEEIYEMMEQLCWNIPKKPQGGLWESL